MFLGLLGVIGFSITLPATRIAVASLDPVLVGLGRSLLAAAVGGLLLSIWGRRRLPGAKDWLPLALAAGGVVIGFPLLTAWAMERVPASHGAVVLGVLPLATAAAGAVFAGERPSLGFWLVALAGSAVVVGFAVTQGGGVLVAADWALLGATLAAAVGYAVGSRLAARLGGWQTISWVLIVALPVTLPSVLFALGEDSLAQMAAAPWQAWLSFLYVALVSQYFAFFAWYAGLSMGGIARVGQVQLLQTFFTLAASWVLLGEALGPLTLLAAALVVALVWLGRQQRVRRDGK